MHKKVLIFLITGMLVLGISRLSSAMMCGSEGEHSSQKHLAQVHPEHEHGTTEAAKEAGSEEAVDVGNKICPVSGEKINEKMKVTYEYEGKIYNFCCPMCINEFKKDPQKYIKKVGEELKAESKKDAKLEKKTRQKSHQGMHMHKGHHH